VTLSEYRNLLDEAEADWIARLERHAEDASIPVETVLAEALIDRHREAGELAQANENLRETIKRLRTN